MEKHKQNLFETAGLVVLFMFVVAISYYHVEQSITVIKYHFANSIRYLVINYFLYHHSFNKFLFYTCSFHPGSSQAGGHTILYLFPLFIFCDFLGGLSLKTIFLFTITASLIFLVLFYWWVRRVWGKEAAFFAAFFLGFSAIFQEFARSGSFDAYSLLITIIWVSFCFYGISLGKPLYFGMLGLLTGVLCYAYGVTRPLVLAAIARTWWSKPILKRMALGLFMGGMVLVLAPGIILLLEQHRNHQGPWHQLFIDKNNILDSKGDSFNNIFKQLFLNIKVFLERMAGGKQIMDYPMKWQAHAHFINPFLVIPMLIGARRAIILRNHPENQLLILIGFLIYLTPMMTAGHGYMEPRRALLYVIPTYCLIGIGCREILDWINRSAHDRVVRGLVLFFIAGSILTVLFSEMIFFRQNIISFKRDLGLLAFADEIKHREPGGDIYYLERRSTFDGARESDVMRLALMDRGKKIFNLKSGWPEDALPDLSKSFFVARSPDISDEDFNNWLILNRLKSNYILESKIINLQEGAETVLVEVNTPARVAPFRFYAVDRTSEAGI